MSSTSHVAIVVSSQGHGNGGYSVEEVYLLAVADAKDPVATAKTVFDSRFGKACVGKVVDYEDVSHLPIVLERDDVVWLTPKPRTQKARKEETARTEASDRPAGKRRGRVYKGARR